MPPGDAGALATRRAPARRRAGAGGGVSAQPGGRPTRLGRAKRRSACAGGRCSSARSQARDPAARAAVGRGRRLRGRDVGARRAPAASLRDGPVRRRQPHPGGLVDRARPVPRGHRPPGATRSRGSERTSIRSSLLLAPAWWRGRTRSLLLVVQAMAVALGAVPVFLLARKHLGSDWAGLGFALVYLLYPPTQWLVVDDFHPVALATPLLLGAIWFLDEDRLLPFALCAGRGVPDEGAGRARRRDARSLARIRARAATRGRRDRVAGAAVAVIATAVIVPHYAPGGGSPFAGRYAAVGGSPGGIVRTAVEHPLRLRRGGDRASRSRLPLRPARCRSPGCRSSRRFSPHRLARAGAEPPLRDAHPDLDPLPLHGGGDPGARRRCGARGGARAAPLARALAALGAGARSRRARARASCSDRSRLAARSLRLEARDARPHRDRPRSRRGAGAASGAEGVPVSATNTLGRISPRGGGSSAFPCSREARWVAVDPTRPSYLDDARGTRFHAHMRLSGATPAGTSSVRRTASSCLARRPADRG